MHSKGALPLAALALQLAFAGSSGIHAKTSGPPVQLFNGRNLDGFYTYLRDHGKNRDPNHVFVVEEGMVHVSGQEAGYFSTEKEYENYHLRVDYKWGREIYTPRKGKARDSGVLFHVNGEDRIWPRSIEFQMIEGGTGDIILSDGVSLTVKGETRNQGHFDRFRKGAWHDVTGYRDPEGDVERLPGGWNSLVLWAVGDKIKYVVNHMLVNQGTGASLRKGRILFQSEGAEVWFRKIELRPLVPDKTQ